MNSIARTIALSAVLFLQQLPVEAQQPAPDLPETKVVLRISREFIHELTAKQVQRDVPIDMNSNGVAVTGTAHAEGTTDVKIQASDYACDFDLVLNGLVSTQLVATDRSVRIHLQGTAPFSARRRIVFADDAFTGHKVEVDTSYRSTIGAICSSRNGLIGEMVRTTATWRTRRVLPEEDLHAADEVRFRLSAAIEKETDELLTTLNRIGSIVKQGEEVLREEKLISARSVQHYLAATERSIYISIGPPEHRIAKLPRVSASERAPIELWVAIKKPGKKDAFSPILANWKLVKPLILPRIAKRSPETAKILDQVQVRTVEDWHVLTFAPSLLESL
jgi:hypothetical protein